MAVPSAGENHSAAWLPGARQLGTLCSGAPVIAIEETALEAILEFSEQDLERERGGFLLGRVYGDDSAPAGGAPRYVVITHFHPAREAQGQLASLTFTHDSWAALSREVQANSPDDWLVGWQHTHPGFGVFLSAYDRFIHTHFFAEPWQVALVVDPRRQELGFFQWQGGEIRDCGFLCFSAQREQPVLTC